MADLLTSNRGSSPLLMPIQLNKQMQITIFKDIKETSQPFYRPVEVILKRIQEGSSKDLVKQKI